MWPGSVTRQGSLMTSNSITCSTLSLKESGEASGLLYVPC